MELVTIENGKASSISLDDLKKALGLDGTNPNKPSATEPAKPYGHPRKQVGTSGQGLPVLVLTGVPGIWLQLGDKPDTIAARGTNLPYTSLPGVPRPVGADTENNGNTPPKAATQPQGYETLWFDTAKKEPYYRMRATDSTQPETEPVLDITHINLIPNGN